MTSKKYDIEAAKLKTERKIMEKLKAKRDILFYWRRIAAILLLPVLIFAVYSHLNRSHESVSNKLTVKTPYGARTSLKLPDGSIVWLNSGSEISYPNQFARNREVNLIGEAFFDVKKSKIPFIVKTYNRDVKVLGTKFDVNAYQGEDFEVTLVEGKVSVSDQVFNKKAFLKPGYQYTTESGQPVINKVPVEIHTSWKNGKLTFKREPFDMVAKRLERWYNVTIELEGESIQKLWYTGTIEMESFSEVLELIRSTTPIEYSFDPNTRILTITSKF